MDMDFVIWKFLVELKKYRKTSESHHARYQMYGAVVEFVDYNVRSFFFPSVWDTAGSRFPLNCAPKDVKSPHGWNVGAR